MTKEQKRIIENILCDLNENYLFADGVEEKAREIHNLCLVKNALSALFGEQIINEMDDEAFLKILRKNDEV